MSRCEAFGELDFIIGARKLGAREYGVANRTRKTSSTDIDYALRLLLNRQSVPQIENLQP